MKKKKQYVCLWWKSIFFLCVFVLFTKVILFPFLQVCATIVEEIWIYFPSSIYPSGAADYQCFSWTSKATCWSSKYTISWSKIYHSEAGEVHFLEFLEIPMVKKIYQNLWIRSLSVSVKMEMCNMNIDWIVVWIYCKNGLHYM